MLLDFLKFVVPHDQMIDHPAEPYAWTVLLRTLESVVRKHGGLSHVPIGVYEREFRLQSVEAALSTLVDQGYVQMSLDADDRIVYSLTEAGVPWAKRILQESGEDDVSPDEPGEEDPEEQES